MKKVPANIKTNKKKMDVRTLRKIRKKVHGNTKPKQKKREIKTLRKKKEKSLSKH